IRRWARRHARLLALWQDAAMSAVDGLLLDRRQPALVVGHDEEVFELVEVGRRLEEGGLDDVVRVALDVDHLADEQAFRIWRAHPATELDARGHDLVADRDRLARVDLAHD